MTPLISTGLANGSEQILRVNQGSCTIAKQGIAAPTGPTAGIPRNHHTGHCIRLAQRAVISAPLRCGHSTTTSAWEKATNQRFRAAKTLGALGSRTDSD